MADVPPSFYRLSIKALILNEAKDKFLIMQEQKGIWELPGGALEYGESPQADLRREIQEEMGLEVASVAEYPSYFVTFENSLGNWASNVVYETIVTHLDFTPSDECVALQFVDASCLSDLYLEQNIIQLAEKFKPERHQ